MTEKNHFSFFSNSFQSLTLEKCLTRAQPHVAGGITCCDMNEFMCNTRYVIHVVHVIIQKLHTVHFNMIYAYNEMRLLL